jgi:hypothetical protein
MTKVFTAFPFQIFVFPYKSAFAAKLIELHRLVYVIRTNQLLSFYHILPLLSIYFLMFYLKYSKIKIRYRKFYSVSDFLIYALGIQITYDRSCISTVAGLSPFAYHPVGPEAALKTGLVAKISSPVGSFVIDSAPPPIA